MKPTVLIHPSQQPELRRSLPVVAVLLLVVLGMYWLPESVQGAAITYYLPLHLALEMLSIVVAALVFGVAWSVRREKPQDNFILLGAAFLGVALLDSMHMLSSQGMPAFITPNTSDKSIYFWLMARSLGALALLAVAWRPSQRGGPVRWRGSLVAVLLLVTATFVLYFWYPASVPRFFVPGVGLTRTKVYWEYALIVVYLAAAARLAWCLHQPRSFHVSGLLAAACILAESGFFFAGYSTVSGLYILAGHVYKAVACLFLYRSVVVEAVQLPYQWLGKSRERLRATLDASPDLIFEMDRDGRYLAVHAGRHEELANAREHLLGRRVDAVLPKQEGETVLAALAEAAEHGISRGRVISIDVLSGEHRWFELSVARTASTGDGTQRFVVASRDITQRRVEQQELLELSAVVSQSPVSIVITDLAASIEYVNDAFTRATGYAASDVIGRNVETLLRSNRMPESSRHEMWAQLSAGRAWQGEFVNLDKDGKEIVVAATVYPLRNAEGQVTRYISHQQDVTAQKRAAERIQQLARYDQLTGLPNRSMLRDHYRYAVARGEDLALFWIDIDHFKVVNDTLGHGVGDLLLQEVARRLSTCLDSDSLLSRHSGDEFVLIVPGADQATAARLAQALLAALSRPLELAGQEFFVSVSVGVALRPGDAGELDGLLKDAEIAMYRAKDEGRNGYRFFAPAMQANANRQLALGNALNHALQRDEFHLVYQPQVVMGDGRIVGAEALLRWDSAQWGTVSPAEFIPIAEASGLIVPIGDWVLRTALRQLRAWLDHGLPVATLAVNLSAAQFNQPGLAERIVALLEEAGVPSGHLELELTEAVAMQAPDAAVWKIEELGRRRIRLAIDDFGTGYSSLSYLKRFKIDQIKIDQSFVRDLGTDPDDQAIVAAIIQMAHSLGMRTIAEGVETDAQLAFLKQRGCDEAQGYLFGRPMLPQAFAELMLARMQETAVGPRAGL